MAIFVGLFGPHRAPLLSYCASLMYWTVEALLPPSRTAPKSDGPTLWVKVPGIDEIPIAGKHFKVRESLAKDPKYVLYPNTPLLEIAFRHQWVMRRTSRPYVPQPLNTPMPDREPTADDRARLFSIYLRPWVLQRDDASDAVPHITNLDVPLRPPDSPACTHQAVAKRRRRCKSSDDGSAPEPRSYTAAWSSYVRGRIVSKHARRVIVQFMAACCGKSSRHEGNEIQHGREPDDAERQTRNDLNLEAVHSVLRDTAKPHAKERHQTEEDPPGSAGADVGEVSRNVLGGIRLSASLWGVDTVSWRSGRADPSGALPKDASAGAGGSGAGAPPSLNWRPEIPGKAFVRLTDVSAQRWLVKVSREKVAPWVRSSII